MGYEAQGDLLDVTKAAAAIATDPHLPEVTCQILRLQKIEGGKNPGPSCPRISTKASPGTGIGLRYATGPLRLFVKTREHPWILPVAVAAILGTAFAVGYVLGKDSK